MKRLIATAALIAATSTSAVLAEPATRAAQDAYAPIELGLPYGTATHGNVVSETALNTQRALAAEDKGQEANFARRGTQSTGLVIFNAKHAPIELDY